MAIHKFDSVLRDGRDANVELSKAAALERIGAYAEARATLEPAAEAGELTGAATGVWARLLMHDGELDAAIDMLRRRLDDGDLTSRQRQMLLFVLGRVYEPLGTEDTSVTGVWFPLKSFPRNTFPCQSLWKTTPTPLKAMRLSTKRLTV